MTLRGSEVVVFGGSGFIGKSLIKRLASADARIRVICRKPNLAGHLKSLGDVGQISLVRFPGDDGAAIEAACARADYVVNLIGILHESSPGDFDRVHAELAGKIAEAAKNQKARGLVQLSAIGASQQSESAYARSKSMGEARVADAFTDAAILRPSIVFGPGDGFFERFGDMATKSPFLPLIDGGKTRFQPVYAGNVADAIIKGLEGERGVFELGGPKIYSFKELLTYLLAILGRHRLLLPLPSSLLRWPAMIMEKLPNPQLTRDQLKLLAYDNIVSPDAPGLLDLGIDPTPLEVIVPSYVRGYASTDSRLARA